MNIFRRLTFALAPLAVSLLAGGQPTFAGQTAQNASEEKADTSPLIDKVRAATARFKDIRVAISEGWVQGTPCVSGPDTGAMGVHFVQPARIAVYRSLFAGVADTAGSWALAPEHHPVTGQPRPKWFSMWNNSS